MSSKLNNFLDENGRVKQWPSKRGVQIEVAALVASKFSIGSTYSEAEVNDIIKEHHTFGDWAIIRREMFELGFFDRVINGSVYTRTTKVSHD